MCWFGFGNGSVGVVGLGTAHCGVSVGCLGRVRNVGWNCLVCWAGLGTALCVAWWAGLVLVGLGTAQLFPGSVGRGGGTYQVGGGTSWLLIGCSGWLLANVGARS